MKSSVAFGMLDLFNCMIKRTGFQIIRGDPLGHITTFPGEQGRVSKDTEVLQSVTPTATDQNNLAALEKRVRALEADSQKHSVENIIRYAMKGHWRAIDLLEKLTGSAQPSRCSLCHFEADGVVFNEIVSQCVFQGGVLIRHQCPNCDVIFGPQKMLALDPELLDLEYRNLYEVYSEGDSTETIIRTFYLLNPRKDGVYLDFGCGGHWSEAIEKLRMEGWNIYGFEPSATHSSEFVYSDWSEMSGLQFDGIYSHNVLEHLFEPIDTTRRLAALLRTGGRIVHATPCFDYRYEYSHYHVFFFVGRSPSVLAHHAGMKIVDEVRDGDFIACVLQNNSAPSLASVVSSV